MLHHIDGNVEYDGGLLAIRCAGVNLGFPFVIVYQHVECQRCAQLGLAVLLGDFDVSRGKLALGGIIVADGAEHITDDLFLPWEQLEGLPMKLALGMLQRFNEADDTLGLSFVISHVTTLPSAAAPWDRLQCRPPCHHRQQ